MATDGEGSLSHAAMLYTDPRGRSSAPACGDARRKGDCPDHRASSPRDVQHFQAHVAEENHPEIYGKAAYVFLMEDYVVYHLTGVRQIDYSLATRTMALTLRP